MVWLTFGLSSSFAEQLTPNKQTIYWQTFHRPPAEITQGKFKGQGFVDRTLKLVSDKLPNYRHVQQSSTLARALEDMQQGKTVCHPALFVTDEREAFLVFSKPSIITPTLQIVARPEWFKTANVKAPVNLKPLLESRKYSFALIKGRSYGETLDKLLHQEKYTSSLFETPVNKIAQVISMVQKGRVNFTLAYPFELSFYFSNSPLSEVPLAELNLSNKAPFSIGSIACPNNKWGREVINQVDKVLEDIRPTAEYVEALSSWWPAQRKTQAFKDFYQHQFLNHPNSDK